MDLTPMIDVTFLLLIFFIVTAKFKSSEGRLEAFLPRDQGLNSSKSQAEEDTRIKLLWVNEQVLLKVGDTPFPTVRLRDDIDPSPDFAALKSFLIQAKAGWKPLDAEQAEKGMPVIIDPRIQVPWKYVVRSLNSCLDAGLTNVKFAASAKPIQ
jgi:biopolymer transport protein ExbD